MNKNYILFFCVFVLFLTSSCAEKKEVQYNETLLLEGYKININKIDEKEQTFSINELEAFFCEEYQPLSTLWNKKKLFLNDINIRFPIKYLRKYSESEVFYIVYPVTEGGNFIVFLMAEINNDTKEKKFIYSNSLYVHNLPEKKVFDNLSIGTDSYQDVKKI